MPSGEPCKPGCTCKKHSDEYRATVAARNTRVFGGKPKSPEHAAKIAASHRGKTMPPKTPEQLARQAESQRRYWANLTPEEKATRVAKSVDARKANDRPLNTKVCRDTLLEKYLESLLLALGFELRKQVWFGRQCVDFVATRDGETIIIEANGCYWHDCPRCHGSEEKRPGKRAHDAARRRRVEDRSGLRVIELWDHELPDWPRGTIDWDAVESLEVAA